MIDHRTGVLGRVAGLLRMQALKAEPADFDGEAYLLLYRDVAASGMRPFRHYQDFGAKEGRLRPRRGEVPTCFAPFFDAAWYLGRYPQARDFPGGAFAHYCLEGVERSLDPGPTFSTAWYRLQYPEAAGCNPLAHYFEAGKLRGYRTAPPKGYLEKIERGLASIRRLEPALYSEPIFSEPMKLPLIDIVRLTQSVSEVLGNILADLPRPPERIMFLPWLTRGGADLEAAHIARAAEAMSGPDALLVVILDEHRIEALEWIAGHARVVCVADRLGHPEKIELVERLLQVIRPTAAMTLNSRAAWDAFRARGHVLKRYAALHAFIFCRDYREDGSPAGYVDSHLRDTLRHLTSIAADNQHIIDEFAIEFALPSAERAKFVALRMPPPEGIRALTRTRKPGTPLNVLWAGRICQQKNPTLLAQIIPAAATDIAFDIWGDGPRTDVEELAKALAGNPRARLRGPFNGFASLPLESYDALLYTSRWDGLPNVLIEAGAAGLPIVAPAVGGIGELVTPSTGYCVAHHAGVAEYLAALQTIASDPDDSAKRALAMQHFIANEHRLDILGQTLGEPLRFLGPA